MLLQIKRFDKSVSKIMYENKFYELASSEYKNKSMKMLKEGKSVFC